jgi:CDP-glycerol glycerophosphotransferase (TagB/SpsB family)
MLTWKDYKLLLRNLPWWPLRWLSGLFSLLIPRDRRRVLMGNGAGGLSGNAKYLLHHLLRTDGSLRVQWLTPDARQARSLRARGVPALHKRHPSAWWACLRAGIYVYNRRPSDINYFTATGATEVNLWHGVGLKGLGFHSTNAVNRARFKPGALLPFLARPWIYARPDYFLSTAPLMTSHFSKAFRISKERCWELGYPRSDHFFLPPEERREWLAQVEGESVGERIDELSQYDRVFVYMPTFRQDRRDFLSMAGFDLDALERAMAAQNALFLVKLHPWTKLPPPPQGKYSHVRFADRREDLYPLLPYTDVLITDYSSVYYDYLLLAKPILLFVFDYEEYTREDRDLILDFDDYAPGPRAENFGQLLELLEDKTLEQTEAQRDVRELFWGDYSGGASEAIAERLESLAEGERL